MISAGAFIAFGLALSYWLVFAFAYLSNLSAAWRVPIAFQIVFALVAFMVLMVRCKFWIIRCQVDKVSVHARVSPLAHSHCSRR